MRKPVRWMLLAGIAAIACALATGCGKVKEGPDGPCQPESDVAFCQRLIKDCNAVTAFDNCESSRTVNCGTCASGAECGGGGEDNVCWLDTWTQLNPSSLPPARQYPQMAYDSAREVVVLFGGAESDFQANLLDDTWEWDGQNWSAKQPTQRPPARWGGSMFFDEARGEIVLFGGSLNGVGGADGVGAGDTWVWNGTTWTQRSPATSPPARKGAAITYDSERDVIVLFGGIDDQGVRFGDLWEWNGTTWTQRVTPVTPPARFLAAMAFDATRNVSVLHGGHDGDDRSDTWEWNGASWSDRTSTAQGPDINGHAMVFDTQRSLVVLFGGFDSPAGPVAETWEYDGSVWQEQAPAERPLPRTGPGVAYDPARGVTLVFGGGAQGPLGDLWTR